MVVGHNIKHGSNVGYASRKDARRAEKKFSVSVTNRPASQGEFNMESEMEALIINVQPRPSRQFIPNNCTKLQQNSKKCPPHCIGGVEYGKTTATSAYNVSNCSAVHLGR